MLTIPLNHPRPRFSSHIANGVNFFGRSLAPGDHAYSTANFSTKIRGFGVWLENYNDAGLSTTPRGYMVPVGNDYLRTISSQAFAYGCSNTLTTASHQGNPIR